tara:strand:+ start:4119 stop:5630 length:1512 start_codon:yes stop_codon:yes gene_type:complete
MSDINALWRGFVSGSIQNHLVFLIQTNIERFLIFIESEGLISNSQYENNRHFQNGINTRDLSKVSQALYVRSLYVIDKNNNPDKISIVRFGNFYKNKIGREEWDSKLDQNEKLVSKIERFRVFFEICNQVILARHVNSHLHEPRNDSGWAMLLMGQIYRLLELDSAKKLSEKDILQIKNHGNKLLKEILEIEKIENDDEYEITEIKKEEDHKEQRTKLEEEIIYLQDLIKEFPKNLEMYMANFALSFSDKNFSEKKKLTDLEPSSLTLEKEEVIDEVVKKAEIESVFSNFDSDFESLVESDELIGIGITYRRLKNGGLKITKIHKGGAVDKEPKLNIDDIIIAVEKDNQLVNLQEIPFEDSAEKISSLLLGKKGSEITISVISNGIESEFSLIRREYLTNEKKLNIANEVLETSPLINLNQTKRELLIIRNKIKKETKCKNWENVLQRQHIDLILIKKIPETNSLNNSLEGLKWYERHKEVMKQQIDIYGNEIDAILNRSSWD